MAESQHCRANDAGNQRRRPKQSFWLSFADLSLSSGRHTDQELHPRQRQKHKEVATAPRMNLIHLGVMIFCIFFSISSPVVDGLDHGGPRYPSQRGVRRGDLNTGKLNTV